MVAVLSPIPYIQNKNDLNTSQGDISFLERKVGSINSTISTQLAQITKLLDEVNGVLLTLIDTQTDIKNSASLVQNDGVDFKNTLISIKKDIVTSLNSFDNKIDKINNLIETIKNIDENNQTESIDILSETLEFISKQLVVISTEITLTQTSFEKSFSDDKEAIYSLLQNITKQINANVAILSSFESKITELNSNVLSLTQRISNIEDYIHYGGCWYGKNEDTGDFDSESTVGWLMTAAANEFGEPVLISNETNEPYAIRHIFIASANMANKIYKIRFYHGISDSFDDAVILSEVLYIKVGNLLSSIPLIVSSPLISRDSRLWCAIKCEAPTATLSLLINV